MSAIKPTTRFELPVERLGQSLIEIINKVANFLLKLLNRVKIAAFQQLPDKNTKPHLNLIEPGGMLRCVEKSNPMGWVTQKSRSRLHGEQDARFTLLPQFEGQITLTGN